MTEILDPCCGSRMWHLDKQNPRVAYCDIRQEKHTLCDGRELIIEPDFVMDFRDLKFANDSFNLVVFDPPHLVHAGKDSYMALKYGTLKQSWQDDLKRGFAECFRVLKPRGTLVFKWNETQIKVSEILKLTSEKPIVGHISGKRANTHWLVFLKDEK